MTSSIAVLVASSLLVSACVASEQPSSTATERSEPGAAPAGSAGAEPEGAPAVTVPQQPPLHLDVRTPAEYDAGHVAGTLHIPLDELERRWQELMPYRDQHVVVYCRTGRRSAAAIELLRSRGFERLENGGGVTQMAARGLPMEPETCC